MQHLISEIILMLSLPHFSDTNKLKEGLQFLLFEVPLKEHLVWPQHSWLSLRTLWFEVILFMLRNFPNRIRRFTRCDMQATAWSCLFTLCDFMSLHRSGTSFFRLHASFKNPLVSQDRLSHTKISLPLERPVLFLTSLPLLLCTDPTLDSVLPRPLVKNLSGAHQVHFAGFTFFFFFPFSIWWNLWNSQFVCKNA